MRTFANPSPIPEHVKVMREIYYKNLLESLNEDKDCLVATALATEATKQVREGFTAKTYVEFWKKFYEDKRIYYLNCGHDVFLFEFVTQKMGIKAI